MPVIDHRLATRLERAESFAMAASIESAARRDPQRRVLCVPVLGGLATFAGVGSPLNKLSGIGMEEWGEVASLDPVERAFDELGVPIRAEVCSMAATELISGLADRGYAARGVEHVLARELDPEVTLEVPDGVTVCEGPDDELDAWVDAMVTGFEHPDGEGVTPHESFPRAELERVLRDGALARGHSRWVAQVDGQVAGAGSLRIEQRVALLGGAATRPELRRRGVQTALVSARLRAAAQAGCDMAMVTVMPGSRSELKQQRRGFSLAYARVVLVRPAGG